MHAALDIQMITQFGEGTGTTFGFASANGSSYYKYASHAYLYDSWALLDPFPDILSISFAGTMDGTSSRLYLGSNRLMVAEASLAKLAAMGITVIAASGDSGTRCHALHGWVGSLNRRL